MDLDKFFKSIKLREAEEEDYDPDEEQPSQRLKVIDIPLKIRKAFDVISGTKNVNSSLGRIKEGSSSNIAASQAILVQFLDDFGEESDIPYEKLAEARKVIKSLFKEKKIAEQYRTLENEKIQTALGIANSRDEAEAKKQEAKKQTAATKKADADAAKSAGEDEDSYDDEITDDDTKQAREYFKTPGGIKQFESAFGKFMNDDDLNAGQQRAIMHLYALTTSQNPESEGLLKKLTKEENFEFEGNESGRAKAIFKKTKANPSPRSTIPVDNAQQKPKTSQDEPPKEDPKDEAPKEEPPKTADTSAGGAGGSTPERDENKPAFELVDDPKDKKAKDKKAKDKKEKADKKAAEAGAEKKDKKDEEPELEDPGNPDEGKPPQITTERKGAQGKSRKEIKQMILAKTEETKDIFDAKIKELEEKGRIGDRQRIRSIVRLNKRYNFVMRRMAQKVITKTVFDAEMSYTRALYYTDITKSKANLRGMQGRLSRLATKPGKDTAVALKRGVEKYKAGRERREGIRSEKYDGDKRTYIRKIAARIVQNAKNKKGFIGGIADLGAAGASLAGTYGETGKEELKAAIEKLIKKRKIKSEIKRREKTDDAFTAQQKNPAKSGEDEVAVKGDDGNYYMQPKNTPERQQKVMQLEKDILKQRRRRKRAAGIDRIKRETQKTITRQKTERDRRRAEKGKPPAVELGDRIDAARGRLRDVLRDKRRRGNYGNKRTTYIR